MLIGKTVETMDGEKHTVLQHIKFEHTQRHMLRLKNNTTKAVRSKIFNKDWTAWVGRNHLILTMVLIND
jgi:hypothetical protein